MGLFWNRRKGNGGNPDRDRKSNARSSKDFTPDELRKMSFDKWYSDEYGKPDSFDPAWAWVLADAEDKLVKKINKSLKVAAQNGHSKLKVAMHAHHRAKYDDGFEVETGCAEEGRVSVTLWNVSEYLPGGQKRMILDSVEKSDALLDYAAGIIAEHFEKIGFSVERTSYIGQELNISWIDDNEKRLMREVVKMPRGYDAYKEGVPVEDILA